MSITKPLTRGTKASQGTLSTDGESFLGVDSSSPVTITLSQRDFSAAGGPTIIKDDEFMASVNAITIATEGGSVKIDGFDTIQITTDGGSVTLLPVTDPASFGWRVISRVGS